VCLAKVSIDEPLRSENEINSQWLEGLNNSTTSATGPLGVGSKLKSRFSFKRGGGGAGGQANHKANVSNSDNEDWKMEDINQPLLNQPKGTRIAAAKMVKG
jgi:hypothetical protein